ncbi:unnamed protein product [Rodentolepis nana]|uniref:Neur_chan_LBD domain-containing protein n=1 Tax=Rodentolepis nana TaxID=102285 RepID=A0A0R3TIF2_RODNA|nr:unnamed protein product [Rodentolepis nana]
MEMVLNLAKGSLITDCLWNDLLTSAWFDLKLNIHYPRNWNSLQTWSFDLTCQEAVFCFLFSQKAYFKAFFDDWSSDSRPDILYFVPYIYKFRFFAQPFELRLLANDYNWVTPTAENSFVSFCVEKLNFDFDSRLSYTQYLFIYLYQMAGFKYYYLFILCIYLFISNGRERNIKLKKVEMGEVSTVEVVEYDTEWGDGSLKSTAG